MDNNDFSGLFAPIYVCPDCGEVWHTEIVESIDTDNDEVYYNRVCGNCFKHEVTPLLHDGHQVVHPLTNEEAQWETWNNNNEDDEEEEPF